MFAVLIVSQNNLESGTFSYKRLRRLTAVSEASFAGLISSIRVLVLTTFDFVEQVASALPVRLLA